MTEIIIYPIGPKYPVGLVKKNMQAYYAWQAAKFRCTNPNAKSWKDYGGRGIRMCPEWMDNFEAFIRHIGPRPEGAYSLDRYPNNDGDYEPGNVRWATPKQQLANRRNQKPEDRFQKHPRRSGSRFIVVDGHRATVAEFARRHKIPYPILWGRLRRGWDPTEAIADSVATSLPVIPPQPVRRFPGYHF